MAAGLLLALALWTIRPVLTDPASLMPVQENLITTVPMFNAWTIWWNAEQLTRGFQGYWDAPIFFPEHGAFAMSEPQPTTLMVSPVYWFTGSPAAAYNAYLLLSLFLNGWWTFVLLRHFGHDRRLAVTGGLLMIWLPISLRQLEVLQCIPVWPMLWTWVALEWHGRRPDFRTAVSGVAAYSVSFFTCIHHTLFLSIVLLPTMWVLFRTFFTRRFQVWSLAAFLSTAAVVGLFALPLKTTIDHFDFQRSETLVNQLSARVTSLLVPPRDAWFGAQESGRFGMSAGWIKLGIVAFGLPLLLRRRRRRTWACFLLATLIISALLSMGPHLKFGEHNIWWLLADWLPGLGQVRNVFRFAYLTQMAVIILFIHSLHEFRLRLRHRFRLRNSGTVLILTIGVLALAETAPPRPHLMGVPDLRRNGDWIEYVRLTTPPGKGIACLPFAAGVGVRDFDVTTRWMYVSTQHGIPLLNGYSGFFPPSYMALRQKVSEQGISASVLQDFARAGAHFVVTTKEYAQQHEAEWNRASGGSLRPVFEGLAGVKVFEFTDNIGESPP